MTTIKKIIGVLTIAGLIALMIPVLPHQADAAGVDFYIDLSADGNYNGGVDGSGLLICNKCNRVC